MTNTTVLADEAGRRPLKSVQSHLGQSVSILGRAVLSVWHAFRSYHERRIAMAQLMALDDRMLKLCQEGVYSPCYTRDEGGPFEVAL